MPAFVSTNQRNTTSVSLQLASDEAKKDLLFEQIGKSAAVQKDSPFSVSLPVGTSEGTVNPLPDYE